MLDSAPSTHSRHQRLVTPTMAAMALVVSLMTGLMTGLVTGLVSVGAQAADATCVGKVEYQKIKSGMSLPRLTDLLDGQEPLVDLPAQKTQRVRWYAACDGWQAVKDVKVRYRQPVVGRKTVLGKKLAVYVPAPTPEPGPKGGPKGGSQGGAKAG